jgi:tetratricopeptide (TPR) repeat protein
MLSRWIGHRLERRLEAGRRHFERGEFAPAAESFEAAAREAAPRRPLHRKALGLAAAARVQLGFALFHAGRDVEAEAELGRALGADPAHVPARYVRARLYHRSGRHRAAIADLAQAVVVHPGHADLYLLLASAAAQEGDTLTAMRALDRALALTLASPAGGPPGPVVAGEPPGSALEALGRAVRERPSYPDLRYHRARLLLDAGRDAEAEMELERALRVNPRYLAARLLLSRLQIGRGAGGRAVRALEAMREIQPGYPDLHFWLGLGRLRMGDPRGAAAVLEVAVALNREFARAQRLLGLVQLRLGRADLALRSIRRGFTRDREVPGRRPLQPPPVPDAARGAEPELRRALALQPDYPDLHLALARVLRAGGDLEPAARSCRTALELKPDYSTAAMELSRIEIERGRPEGAVGFLIALARRHPGWADAHALLGRISCLKGDAAGAQAPLRTALSLNPSYSEARADLAWALGAEGRSGSALDREGRGWSEAGGTRRSDEAAALQTSA